MRVISRRMLRQFWERNRAAEGSLKAWFKEAKEASWTTPSKIKEAYSSASFLAGDRVVFNIKGNSYRLVVAVRYSQGIVFVRFVGTHAEYDRVNAVTI